MKILLKIHTPNRDTYNIYDNGDIQRTDMQHTPSGQWKLQGIEHVKQSWFIPLSQLNELSVSRLNLLFKNGNPQFTVRDLDHGTTRVWGNTKYHGIKRIEFVKVN